jgi:cbb3-type cytochrome oxidase maturation protein
MDSLYLLIPLSVLLVLAVTALLVWAVTSGQFEHIERAADRALRELPDDDPGPDDCPAPPAQSERTSRA